MKRLRPSVIVYALISFYIKRLSTFEQSIAFVLTIIHANTSFKALYTTTQHLLCKPELKTTENQ